MKWEHVTGRDEDGERFDQYYFFDETTDRVWAWVDGPFDDRHIFDVNIKFQTDEYNDQDPSFMSLEAAQEHCESLYEKHTSEDAKEGPRANSRKAWLKRWLRRSSV